MAAAVPVIPKFKFVDPATNLPLANGSVTVYLAGTTTPATTYQDRALSVLNTNPVNLDANGECTFWTSDANTYKFLVTDGPDGTGATVSGWPVDEIPGNASSSASSMTFTPAGTGAVSRTVQDKLREVVSVADFGAVGNGIADDSAAIQAAIDFVATRGGGEIHFPAGDFAVTSTLTIRSSNIKLTGAGGGYTRQGTQPHRDSSATRIFWNAAAPAAGTPLLQFQTPTGGVQAQSGGGMSGIQLDGMAVCPVGLKLHTWRNARFVDVFCYAFTEDQFLLGVVDWALSSGPADCLENTFHNCIASTFGGSGWYLTSTARGFRLTGGTATHTGNSCFNSFYSCRAYMSKGHAYVLENCDNNRFFACSGGAAYGVVPDFDFIFCSGDEDTGTRAATARHNHLYGCEVSVWARSSKTGLGSSHANAVIGVSTSNGKTDPAIESPAGGSKAATMTFLTSGDEDMAGTARMGTTTIVKHGDTNTIEPALLLQKNSTVGAAGMGLAKIQWRMTNDAGTRNIDAGRFDSVIQSAVAGAESAVVSVHPQYLGNGETNPCMSWRNGVNVPLSGAGTLTFQGFGTVNISTAYYVANTKVVGARVTGWNAPTGTQTRGTFDVATATTATTAQALAALIADLRTHGLIGT